MLQGLALGDALGAGYEFQEVVGEDPCLKGGGMFDWAPGEWTDDTQMATCIAEVAASGFLDPVAVGQRFLEWFRSGPTDVGNQTRSVLSSAGSATGLHDVAARYFERYPDGAAGNGSLMRTAPVALAYLGDDRALADAARTISDLTHADPLAGDACVLWCIAIDRAVREKRLDGIWEGLELLPAESRERWRGWLQEAASGPPSRFAPNMFVVPALQAAYAAIVHTPIPDEFPALHLTRVVKAAVKIGYDTDTVAAIAGSLVGARWGSSAIPASAKALLHGWPGYRARDLSRLAILAVNGGVPDSIGWPTEKSLIPGYIERGAAYGKVGALSREPNVVLGDIAALEKWRDQCDVIVSLCRVGTEDLGTTANAHEVMLMDYPDREDNPNLEFVLMDLARSIGRWVDDGKKVFVHCAGANSRTPTVAAAFLAERHGLSGIDALAEVRRDVPGQWHNVRFRDALERLWPQNGKPAVVLEPLLVGG